MSIFSFTKSKISIFDLVSEYVQLKKIGGYWKGSCPFHTETDASFTVSPDRGIFYCFGCHEGGDAIAFISKIENMTPIESAYHLVDKYSLELPEEEKKDFKGKERVADKDRFFYLCESVANWAHEQLTLSRQASLYLEKRKIQKKEIERFSIGYFSGGSRSLNRLIKELSKKNILLKDLVEAGIVGQGRSAIYSSFEERILFPIKDALGRCCGFGGRVFKENDERAKYYNSKESAWFLKGQLLFGIDLAKKEMQSKEHAFLVEGYTDCVAMVGAGYKNTVATLGTACTIDHLKILSRYIKKLYVLYDGDSAGQKAILRLTKLCWDANLDLQIIQLSAKEDPASFINGGGDLSKLIEQSVDIFTFFVHSLGSSFWGKSLSEKMRLCEKIIEVIYKIEDDLKKSLLLQQASNVMQIPLESLIAMLSKKVGGESRGFEKNSEEISVNKNEMVVSPIEAKIVSFVVNSCSRGVPLSVDDHLRPYFGSVAKAVLEKVDLFMQSSESRTVDAFLDFLEDDEMRAWILKESFLVDGESTDAVFETLLFRFQKNNWKKIVQGMKSRIFEAKRENNGEALRGLLDSFLKLQQDMRERGLV